MSLFPYTVMSTELDLDDVAAQIALAQSQLAVLRSEIAQLHDANERFGKRLEWWTEQIFVLEQERDALRADAEALRAGFNAALWFMQDQGRLKLPRDYSPMTGEMFAAIDAARAAKGQG